MANELQITKEQTAQFVNDAMEMEKAIFTLGQAMEDCENKKKEILDGARTTVNDAKARKESIENDLSQICTAINGERSFSPEFPWSDFIMPMLFVSGPIIAVIGIIGGLQGMMNNISASVGSSGTNTSWIIIAIIIALIIGAVIGKLCANSDINDRVKNNQEHLKENEQKQLQISEDLRKAQNAYNNAIAAQKRAIESANLLDAQKEQLKENRDSIYQSLTACYENNIIKPKYRNIECVVIMNELYQNDRVDTMREAMDKCEERLFQNEVVRGVHNINTMLGKMVISLAEISSTLESINFNLGMMSQDLFNISDQIAQGQREQQKSNEELIRETKLSRYAAERTAAAATYMEWYGPNSR